MLLRRSPTLWIGVLFSVLASASNEKPIQTHLWTPLENVFESYKIPIRAQIAEVSGVEPADLEAFIKKSLAERRNLSLLSRHVATNPTEARLDELFDELKYVEDLQAGERRRLFSLASEYEKLEPKARKKELESLAAALGASRLVQDYRVSGQLSEERLLSQRDTLERILILLSANFESTEGLRDGPEGLAAASAVFSLVSTWGGLFYWAIASNISANSGTASAVLLAGVVCGVAVGKTVFHLLKKLGFSQDEAKMLQTLQYWQSLFSHGEFQQLAQIAQLYVAASHQACARVLLSENQARNPKRVRVESANKPTVPSEQENILREQQAVSEEQAAEEAHKGKRIRRL